LEELEDVDRQDNGQEPLEEPEKPKSSNKKVYYATNSLFSFTFLITKSLYQYSFGS